MIHRVDYTSKNLPALGHGPSQKALLAEFNPTGKMSISLAAHSVQPVQSQANITHAFFNYPQATHIPASMFLRFGAGGVINPEVTKAYHKSDEEGNQYERYNPANVDVPLAVYHTIKGPQAHRRHLMLGESLERFLSRDGSRDLDIPWIMERKPLNEIEYTVFDVETTGLDDNARIIQLAASPVKRGHRVDHFTDYNELFHPGTIEGSDAVFEIDKRASNVHGIWMKDVADKPSVVERLTDIRTKNQDSLLGKRRLLVAYNARFDVGRMNEAIRIYNGTVRRKADEVPEIKLETVIDPFILIQRIHPFMSQKKTLATSYRVLMGGELENKHDAQADVDATVDVLKYIFKYLQKHAVPKAWGEFTAKFLEHQVGSAKWNEFDRPTKAAMIGQWVREHRDFLENKLPEFVPEPIRVTDVLLFQFGRTAYHDGKDSYLPVFDITLDPFGLSQGKYWDATDRMDLDIARQVREERQQENYDYLMQLYRSHDIPYLDELAQKAIRVLDPLSAADPGKFQSAWTKFKWEMVDAMGGLLADAIIQRKTPDEKELAKVNKDLMKQLQPEFRTALEEIFHKKLQKAYDTKSGELKDGFDQAAIVDLEAAFTRRLSKTIEDAHLNAEAVLQKIGTRYFYAYRDIDDELLQAPVYELMKDPKRLESSDILIDPATVRSYQYALERVRKNPRENITLNYQNPDVSKQGIYTPPPGVIPVEYPKQEEFPVSKALLILPGWANQILDGNKTWEIRGQYTHYRGPIALIESGAVDGYRQLTGIVYIDDCIRLQDVGDPYQVLLKNTDKHGVSKAILQHNKEKLLSPNGVGYDTPHAYKLSKPYRLKIPIPVPVKGGQITWVNFNPEDSDDRRVLTALKTAFKEAEAAHK